MTLLCSPNRVGVVRDGDLANLHSQDFWEENRDHIEEYLKRIQPYQTAFGAQLNFSYTLTK